MIRQLQTEFWTSWLSIRTREPFLAEGINVAANPKIVTAIIQGGQKVGNYTYVGLSNVDKLPVDKAFV